MDTCVNNIAAVAEPDVDVRPLSVVTHCLELLCKLMAKLDPPTHLTACYKSGPTGYGLYWPLTALGVSCEALAISLVPGEAGDRVKKDRRNPAKLACRYRVCALTLVSVLDAAYTPLSYLIRTRADARLAQQRGCQGLGKFLQRHGSQPLKEVKKNWTLERMDWISRKIYFDQPSEQRAFLEYLRGAEYEAEGL